VVYGLLGVREFGLYVALGALNFPASLAVLPVSERVASALDVPIGGATHVWATQVTSMLANGAIIAAGFALRHYRRRSTKSEHAV